MLSSTKCVEYSTGVHNTQLKPASKRSRWSKALSDRPVNGVESRKGEDEAEAEAEAETEAEAEGRTRLGTQRARKPPLTARGDDAGPRPAEPSRRPQFSCAQHEAS